MDVYALWIDYNINKKNISVLGISQLYEDVAGNLFFLCSVPCPSHQLMLLQFIIRAILVFSPPIIITLFFHVMNVIKKREEDEVE